MHAADYQTPGADEAHPVSLWAYVIGLCLAAALTGASFWAASSEAIYAPGVPILLGVLAIAQMGIHLVFFLHISSAPDQANNFFALTFGVFIVGLIVFGSMIIINNLNHAMMPMHGHG